jgi:arsenate reductase-like glutaredoxin family protein
MTAARIAVESARYAWRLESPNEKLREARSMPAPLGTTPTKKMPKIAVLGIDDSPSTRAAVRFFRERRIVVRFVDLSKTPIDAGELRRLIDKLGGSAFVDGNPGTDRGSLVGRVRADPSLLRLPLVIYGDDATAGPNEPTWAAWLAGRKQV